MTPVPRESPVSIGVPRDSVVGRSAILPRDATLTLHMVSASTLACALRNSFAKVGAIPQIIFSDTYSDVSSDISSDNSHGTQCISLA